MYLDSSSGFVVLFYFFINHNRKGILVFFIGVAPYSKIVHVGSASCVYLMCESMVVYIDVVAERWFVRVFVIFIGIFSFLVYIFMWRVFMKAGDAYSGPHLIAGDIDDRGVLGSGNNYIFYQTSLSSFIIPRIYIYIFFLTVSQSVVIFFHPGFVVIHISILLP